MERSEPTFVPEWYKGTSSSATGSSSSNYNNGSLHSATDEHNYGISSRNRLSVSVCDHDAPRSLSLTDRTSLSFRRTGSSNGCLGREKELASRAYSNFGRSHRDRDREKDLDIRNRDRTLLADNGFSNYPDSLITNKPEKNYLRRSQSSLSGRHFDSWPKRPEHESSNNVLSEGIIVTGISKSSFERDFPSLGAEEKYVGSEEARVSSPGLTSAIHIFPVTASAIIGSDGWTSALAEPIVGGNGPVALSALQTSPSVATASSTSASLNMAEALAQAPARVRTSPQPPSDSQKIEELHRQKILKLRPVTPSMPKNLGLNPADKSKTKGARAAEFSTSKGAQQISSQPISHTLRSVARSDAPSKTSQPGHFQVLNRERNGLSPTGKDIQNPANVVRVPISSNALPSASVQPIKGPTNLKLKFDGKSGASAVNSYGEKRTPSQAQNRNDFFNSLRKKTSASQHTNANDDPSCDASSSNLGKVGEKVVADSASAKRDMSSLKTSLQCPVENRNCSVGGLDNFEPEKLALDEEEAAFLRSLGWEENAGEEALTREEIESFLSEHKNQRLASKLKL